MTLQMTQATPADLPKIGVYDPHIPTERIAAALREGHVYLLRDSITGGVLGVLRYSLFWQTIPFLEHLYLDGRIRHYGYGSMMMRMWEREMKRAGFSWVMTSTQADETAWRFYEKLGYAHVGGFQPPEQFAEEMIYTKKL